MTGKRAERVSRSFLRLLLDWFLCWSLPVTLGLSIGFVAAAVSVSEAIKVACPY